MIQQHVGFFFIVLLFPTQNMKSPERALTFELVFFILCLSYSYIWLLTLWYRKGALQEDQALSMMLKLLSGSRVSMMEELCTMWDILLCPWHHIHLLHCLPCKPLEYSQQREFSRKYGRMSHWVNTYSITHARLLLFIFISIPLIHGQPKLLCSFQSGFSVPPSTSLIDSLHGS